MNEADRKPTFRAERKMTDYLRPLLQAIYPPRVGGTPKDLAGRLRRLRLDKSDGQDKNV